MSPLGTGKLHYVPCQSSAAVNCGACEGKVVLVSHGEAARGVACRGGVRAATSQDDSRRLTATVHPRPDVCHGTTVGALFS